MPSSLRRFSRTYLRLLKLAYQVSPSRLILVILINSFWGLTNLPVLYINKLLIDVVISNIANPSWRDSVSVIILILLIRTLIEASRSTLSRLNQVYTNNLTTRINAYVEAMLAKKLNLLDMSRVENSEFQNRYRKMKNEANQRIWGMIGPLAGIPNAFFTIISGLIPLITFHPLIWLLVLIARIPEIIANSRIARREYQEVEKNSYLWKLWGWVSHHLTHSGFLYENKILDNIDYLSQKMQEIQLEAAQAGYNRRMYRAKLRILADFPNHVFYLGINAYFFILALAGRITLGTAQMLYQAANTLGTGLGQFFDELAAVYENYLFVNDITEYLDLPEEQSSGHTKFPEKLQTGIEFRDVWFKYPGTDKWILKGISFNISPEQNIALVGENGAGKTTLIKLLCGFYPVDKGEILVDGKNIRNFDLHQYRNQFSVLFQDFASYPFSVRESIAYGDLSHVRDTERIKIAAAQTGINEFIEELPLKYDNPLSRDFDHGVEPSKGQWQRIALSRALFRKARIVILDEPTSNVDPRSEENIFDQIISLTRRQMLILISHRFSTVRRADKILVIEDGKITESGNHTQLMRFKGKYRDLFQLQAKAYK